MDYAAFGEEVSTSVGQRTAQGYGITDSLRQKYALTERDEASGLDHTWFRKNESRAGRWTSPDPYNGSIDIGNPQSLNRYSYVENQPANYADPSGLMMLPQSPDGCVIVAKYFFSDGQYDSTGYFLVCSGSSTTKPGTNPGEETAGGGGPIPPGRKKDPPNVKSNDCDELEKGIIGIIVGLEERFREFDFFDSIGAGDAGHVEQIEDRQRQLQKNLDQFYQKNKCRSRNPRLRDAQKLLDRKPEYKNSNPMNRVPPVIVPKPNFRPVVPPVLTPAPTFITPIICIVCNPGVLYDLLKNTEIDITD